MDKTQKDRQQRLRQRNKRRGLVQVKIWIPGNRRAELIRTAAAWRRVHRAALVGGET